MQTFWKPHMLYFMLRCIMSDFTWFVEMGYKYQKNIFVSENYSLQYGFTFLDLL